MNAAAQAVLALCSLIYPFLWYFGRDRGWFGFLALGMMLLWAARAVCQRNRAQQTVSIVAAVFFAFVWWLRLPWSMYWYPVMVNVLMLAVFGGSLFSGQSVIERLARLKTPDLPESGIRYTRKITQIWCVFFLLNGSIAAVLTVTQRYDWWAVYTGIIAYVLMGLLFALEWLYRKYVLKVSV